MQWIFGIVCAFLLAVAIPGADAAGFTPGNMVVLRAGDGSTALSSAATAVFLDEYTPAGTPVQSLAVPIAASGGNSALTVTGNSTAEGALRRSADGRYLTLAGYNAAPGTAGVSGTASATTNRVVARVDTTGAIDTTTTISNFFSAGNIRGAVTDNGTNIWTVGNKDGVQFVTLGSTGTSTQINSAAPTNLRVPGIFNNQLYVSSASGTFQGVGTVGSGLPTTGPQTPTLLSGFPTATGPSSYGFYMPDTNTVYVADDRATASGGGIQKWTLTAGTWTLTKTMNNGISAGVRGLTGNVSGQNVMLYATTTDNKLVTVTDDGTVTPAFTVLATAPVNTAFRGVDLAPAPLIQTVTMTTVTAGSGSGSISGVVNPYIFGSTATITANPATGSTFTAWSGCSTATTPSIDVTMDVSKSCTANFSLIQYAVKTSAGAGGSITPSADRLVDYNTKTTFTVTPDSGYKISSVNGCGGTLTGTSYTTDSITGDCTVSALFAQKQVWKFGVMSDTQWPTSPDNKNPNVAVNVIRHLNTEFINKGVKFVVQVGDLTDTVGTSNINLDVRATFAQDLYNAGIGFYPLRGNHESSAAGAVRVQQDFPQTQTCLNNQTPNMVATTIYGPQANTSGTFCVGSNFSSEPGLEGLTYSFDFNNARFVLIDQFTKPAGTAHANLDATDVDWIGNRFSSRTPNTHAFSFAHKGLVTENHADNLFNSTNPTASQASKDLMETFMGYLQNNGVRYHMGGHDHMHNRAIVSSPNTGAYKVQNLIGASNSYKFYIPPVQSTFTTQSAFRSLEKPIAQELFTVGYYIFTVDGPKVTVDHYAMPNGCDGDCDMTTDVIPYSGNTPTANGKYTDIVPFTKHDSFGYSLNGIEKIVDQGLSYALIDNTDKAIANGETGYKGTTAAILSGANGSTGMDYNLRPLTKSVNTGWAAATTGLASDIFTLWGMQDNLATKLTPIASAPTFSNYTYAVPDTSRTDTYTLSMSYNPAMVTAETLNSGIFGLAVKDETSGWANAIVKNFGGTANFVLRAWQSGDTLGTCGIDTATHTAWAVINHGSDFAITSFTPRSVTVTPSGALPLLQTATITSTPAGINCTWDGTLAGGQCDVSNVTYGTGMVLTAAAPGATVAWGGGCDSTTATTCTINSLSANMSLTATFMATPVNGACGSDNNQILAATAPTNLCSAGSASLVTGSGHPWNWTCAGAYLGTTASCSATIQTYTLLFSADGNGTLEGATSQTIDHGASSSPVTAKAKDANSFYFYNWTGTGFTTSTSNPLTISNVTSSQSATANFKGGFTIYHVNDTHARLTPHKWIVTEHSSTTAPVFEDVGGAAYLAGKMLDLVAAQPNSLVIDAGDISEGNPIGDMGGNGSMTQFYTLLSGKLNSQRGRGMDAVVVGNHDVRDQSYIDNLTSLKNSGVPVISVNVRDASTHQPFFAPYNIVTINNTKIGILGYTTQSAEVGATLASTLVVDPCDWDGTSTTPDACHLADYVNDLRNNQGCDVVILAAHIGHSAIVDPAAPLLVDNGKAKVPEVAVTGHWHTWTDTVWQESALNYKTIFTESASYMKYIGELKVTNTGAYVSSTQHVIRDADITPDPDVQALVTDLTTQYNVAHPGHPVEEVIGYTGDNLMLDNNMKWWSANEYPWSGNNTAGQWICDAMRWKAEQLFGQCDLSIETGGGVRADIPAGPVTYLQIYETFPWNDDTFYRINMTGQEIVNFLKLTNLNAGFSSALDVTAVDGIATSIKFNGQPIDINKTYTVAINNYMYAHPPTGWSWSDTQPLTSPALCREGIVDFMRNQHPDQEHAYQVGGPRYHLNTEFSGGYRAVVTMMNDGAATKAINQDAFIRFLSATPETLARRGSNQVPSDLVNADGTINAANRLSEQELYRSHLGFKTGVLKPGDIVETWGKGSFYGGNPEFVDQEGIYADGVEFKIVGHDDSLAKPAFLSSIGAFWNDGYKNHYVQFMAKKTGTSTVTDQYGQTLTIMDVTAYTAKSLPGAVGDTLLISGVPTMESYGLRFRCDKAATTSTVLPAAGTVSSRVGPLPAGITSASITLNASAAVNSGTFYLAPLADAQIASGKPDTTTNNNNLYIQSASSANSYGNERAWLKFDLSAIPSNTSISGVSLQLYDWKATGAAMPVEVRGGNDDTWTEAGISWNTQPTFGTPLATQTLAAGVKNVWYAWDVTSFVQTKLGGNKLVSLLVKPVTEDSTDVIPPSYAFDAKEYGSNGPLLQVSTQAGSATVAQVQFFYRFSSDNITWGLWTPLSTANSVPYTATMNFPNGQGYYEFSSQATDSNSNVEPLPAAAQAATHYTSTPAYYPIISLDGLYQKYDGAAKPVTVTTFPAGTPATVTYNGDSTVPVFPGTYMVTATASSGGNTVSTTGALTIVKATATVSLSNLSFVYDSTAKSATVTTNPANLPITVTYNGATTLPVNVGTYAVVAMVSDANYHGEANGTLTITQPTLSVSVIGNGKGDIHSAPSGITCSENTSGVCTNTFSPGTVILNASASPISLFGGWSGCAPTSSTSCEVLMDGDKSVTATFTLAPKAMIGSKGYDSLNAAYKDAFDSMESNATIHLLETELTEDLDIIGKDIFLVGGFSADYKSRSGFPTFIKGLFTVKGGSLRVDGVKVRQ